MTRSRIALLFLSLLALACGGVPKEARKADQLLKRGDYEGAELAAAEALSRHPDQRALWRIRIQAAMGQGDSSRAVALYRTFHDRRGRHDKGILKRMALTTLWQGLRVPSAEVRVHAIQAVERLEIERLARDVADRMTDDDDVVAAAASVALLRSQPVAPRIATQLLQSDDPRARAIVVAGIGRKVGKLARADIVPGLGDSRAEVRSAAATAVGLMKTAEDTERLLALARDDPDAGVRAAALVALGRSDAAARAAGDRLGDGDREVRLAAVAVLLRRHDKKAALERAMNASDPVVALHAAVGLGAAGDAVRARFEKVLADHDPEVRVHALAKLGDLGAARASAAKWAAAALADPSPKVRAAAAVELANLGDRRGLDALSALCGHDDSAVRERAVLGHRRAKVPSSGLVAVLADNSAVLRVQAAEVILELITK